MRGSIRRRATLLAVILSASLGLARAASVPGLVKEGNRLYEEGNFAEALERYLEAETLAPEVPALHYNIGNVYYRQGEFDKAYEHYRQAFSATEGGLAQGARYNAGNSHFARENWNDAINNYKEALRLDPADRDAKRNLELALQRLQEQQQQQQQQQRQQEQQEQQQEQPDRSPQEQSPQERTPDQETPPPDPRDQQAPAQPRDKDQLSREEAMRILDAMRDQDKPPKEQLKVRPPDRRPEKDW